MILVVNPCSPDTSVSPKAHIRAPQAQTIDPWEARDLPGFISFDSFEHRVLQKRYSPLLPTHVGACGQKKERTKCLSLSELSTPRLCPRPALRNCAITALSCASI